MKREVNVQKYTYRVEWSEEDQAFVGRVLEFPSLGAHGKDSISAHRELVKVVGSVVEDLTAQGEPVPEPLGMQKFAGKIPLRVSPDLHRRLKMEAAERKVSLNQYLVHKLAK